MPGAEYQLLDLRTPFPFANESFDLILANMIFNEITTRDLRYALKECHRVPSSKGRILATVIHPTFVKSLARREQLKPHGNGLYTMPASDGLRLPVALRSLKGYQSALQDAGFRFQSEDIFGTRQVLSAKPGLRQAGKTPIGMLLECEKNHVVTGK